jgi:hypothetical protein
LLGLLEVGFYGGAHLWAPEFVFRQSRLANPEPVERNASRMDQITGATNDLTRFVYQEQMPALCVAVHWKTPIVSQFAGLDGTILEIDPAAQPLRLMQIMAMKLPANLRACEIAVGR